MYKRLRLVFRVDPDQLTKNETVVGYEWRTFRVVAGNVQEGSTGSTEWSYH